MLALIGHAESDNHRSDFAEILTASCYDQYLTLVNFKSIAFSNPQI